VSLVIASICAMRDDREASSVACSFSEWSTRRAYSGLPSFVSSNRGEVKSWELPPDHPSAAAPRQVLLTRDDLVRLGHID
jgi:hypothetical protein